MQEVPSQIFRSTNLLLLQEGKNIFIMLIIGVNVLLLGYGDLGMLRSSLLLCDSF